MEVRKDMDVIFYSIYLKKNAILVFHDSPDVPVKLFFIYWVNCREIVFGMKSNVINDLAVTTHS